LLDFPNFQAKKQLSSETPAGKLAGYFHDINPSSI
jgi:hypothetical protein